MFIKLTTDYNEVVYVNTQHITYVTPQSKYSKQQEDGSYIMLRDNVSTEVKESPEQIMTLLVNHYGVVLK